MAADSTAVRLCPYDQSALDASRVHLLPCAIEHTGGAAVSTYFSPVTTDTVLTDTLQPTEEAHFRGRLLRGVKLQLPEDCAGAVLAREPSASTWRSTSGFTSLTAWNHDTVPGAADVAPRLVQWLRLASALHAPVPTAAVDGAVAQRGQGGRGDGIEGAPA